MTMIDENIITVDAKICSYLDSIDGESRGAISQDILAQLIHLVEQIMLKFYAGGRDIDDSDDNIAAAMEYSQTNGELKTLFRFRKHLQIVAAHITLDENASERLMLKYYPKFLEEISRMKEKNLAVELLKRLISEQVHIYKRTNLVKSEKFSEIMQSAMNRYLNGMLTNEEVIQEMLNLAKQIREAKEAGEELGLTADELAFYDALTKPQAIKDFYENAELIAITKELAEKLRKNRTIDWQKRDSARAKMRMMIRKLLKDHRYPPEGMDDAVTTVMSQCELWADNMMTV